MPELRAHAIALLADEVPRWVVSRPSADNADFEINGSTSGGPARVEKTDPERQTEARVAVIAILYFILRLGSLALRIAMVAGIVPVVIIGIFLLLHGSA